MRDLFGTRPRRAETDPALVVAVQNFKGGVGKSTLVCHLAQSLALKGYRVAVIDCDSQASTTTVFGFNPDADIQDDETLLLVLPARRAVRPPVWPQAYRLAGDRSATRQPRALQRGVRSGGAGARQSQGL